VIETDQTHEPAEMSDNRPVENNPISQETSESVVESDLGPDENEEVEEAESEQLLSDQNESFEQERDVNIKELEGSPLSKSESLFDYIEPTVSYKKQEPEQKSNGPKLEKKEVDRRLGLLVTDFSACGRCSYFLTGYRVVHGEAGMETAVTSQKGKWLKLAWNHPMRELITKSYGVPLDVDFYHYDSCCRECGRRITLKTKEKKDQLIKDLRIEISN
jgi:hypothetical protein